MIKIGFYKLGLDREQINTIFGGMYRDFFSAISDNDEFTATHFVDEKDVYSFDIIVLPMGGNQDISSCRVMDKFKHSVILYTPPAEDWFKEKMLKRWSDKILFVYNTDESDYSRKKYESINIDYVTIPFASNPQKFRPVNVEKIYDVAFVASAESGKGRFKYIDLLMKKAEINKWNVLLLGRGWQKYNIPLQLVAHGELLNLIYNSAKICINISNDEQKLGQDKRLDSNNRLFDLAMAGCFQISNAPQIVRKYFNEDEVCSEDDPEKFIEKITYYLSHENERTAMAEKVMKSARANHLWKSRADKFCQKIKETLSKNNDNKPSVWMKLYRKIDIIKIK